MLATAALPKHFLTAALFLLAAARLATAQALPPDAAADAEKRLLAEAEKRLLTAAGNSRAAYLAITSSRVGLADDDLVAHRGFFLSAEGLAVAPLEAFDHGQFNATLEADQTPLRIAGVVAADLATGLAVVRTDHRPAKWLTLRPDDSAVGDRIALYRAEGDGGSLTALVLARRTEAHARSRAYNEVFSLGVNLGELGVTQAPAGTPVLDAAGHVAGILSAPSVTAQQRLLFAYPSSGLRAQMPPDPANSAIIPFPLPKSLQPADPLTLDATYLLGRRAQLAGSLLDAERLLRKAVARHPESAAGWERLAFTLRDLRRDRDALAALDKSAELGKSLAGFALNRANQLRLMNRLDEATAVLEAACQDTPHDYKVHRALASALQAKDDPAGAERHARTAAKLAPDVISNWELLSKCLAAQGKWDEEKLASDEIHKLESLYRPR